MDLWKKNLCLLLDHLFIEEEISYTCSSEESFVPRGQKQKESWSALK